MVSRWTIPVYVTGIQVDPCLESFLRIRLDGLKTERTPEVTCVWFERVFFIHSTRANYRYLQQVIYGCKTRRHENRDLGWGYWFESLKNEGKGVWPKDMVDWKQPESDIEQSDMIWWPKENRSDLAWHLRSGAFSLCIKIYRTWVENCPARRQ